MQDFDFHIHTNCSDGDYSVIELIDKLKDLGIKEFSITDHDNIASSYIMDKIDLTGLKYIRGVEISAILDNKYKMHLLGYNYDNNNEELKNMLDEINKKRKEKFLEMVDNLNKQNIILPKNEIDELINKYPNIGKPHLGALLYKHGYGKDCHNAINVYLDTMTLKININVNAEEVIKKVHDAKGFVIWAHPKKVERKYNISFDELMKELLLFGLDGIEVYNSQHSKEDSKRFLKYAKENNIIISGGSDYHGPSLKPHVNLGVLNITDEVIDKNNITIIERI